ncbi:hypothetical protein COT66_00855 [Candidatus Shapirobacteria bacterium CG09_land_8_20_14_0_10_49_15]|uniref:Resolvase HTH domain-containing protein n=2 Tax=Candidatus Shapironibacteriota TaxID=1752721 RepID=A0A2M8L7L9_9BACT|nr:MAG: hypothetical protein COT66_00855 [Candidatus Shapirobacteria bacterium CG09_land_8_20_14_0_10_49_15]PJE70240.1 MAG: hypothetical protein COU97_00790 [Candidatus Shapirobacteria bacterium CG10_big_fil_rev_8_21_14_0_10_48_15]
MAKSQEKLKARQLRREGESIKVIAKKLKVSSSSASNWCRDIRLKKDQVKKLERRAHDPNYGRRLKYTLRQQKKRIKKTNRLKKQGIREIGELSKRELFLVGVALYWAEGYKKDNQVGFGSSDPEMVKTFFRWLYESCGCKPQDLILRVTVNISHRHRIREIENYWSKITEVPVDEFRKPFYQRVKWKKIYENPNDYFGVLRIRVRKSTDFLRKIHGWIEGLAGAQ